MCEMMTAVRVYGKGKCLKKNVQGVKKVLMLGLE